MNKQLSEAFSHITLPQGWNIVFLPETDSTMLQLKNEKYAPHPGETTLLVTDFQTAGRGQRGTSWEADAGENLLFGFIFHPESVPVTHQFALSEALALAVCRSLQTYAEGFTVKWPNDIYWHDKKICGMLLEHTVCGAHLSQTLTGVGLNINQKTFRSDAPNPISLWQILGKEVDRAQVLAQIVEQFATRYDFIKEKKYDLVHEEYMRNLYRREGFHAYRDANGEFCASIENISPIGMLTLKRTDGTLSTYAFKEVQAIINPQGTDE